MKAKGKLIAISGGKNRKRAQAWPDDPRDIPMFSIPVVARYLRMKSASLADWTKPKTDYGQHGEAFSALIQADDSGMLSFNNALEAHVLLGTRRIHKVSMLNVRRAMEWVRGAMPTAHPLIDYQFKTNGKHLFISKLTEEYISDLKVDGTEEEIVNASQFGQVAIESVVSLFLDRIRHTDSGSARRLFPIVPNTNGEAMPVMMDMGFASGQLVIAETGITVASVYGRFKNSNHSVEKLAKDYRVPPESIRGAIEYFATAA